LFSQTVGHLSYEILRILDDSDPCTQKVKDALQQIATAGYNSALMLKDDCCFDKLEQLKQKYTSGGKTNKRNRKSNKHRTKYRRKS
jgi:hypothetical protein